MQLKYSEIKQTNALVVIVNPNPVVYHATVNPVENCVDQASDSNAQFNPLRGVSISSDSEVQFNPLRGVSINPRLKDAI